MLPLSGGMPANMPMTIGHFFGIVPGGSDGPSGILICSENYLTYKNFGDQQDLRMPIPRRKVNNDKILIFSWLLQNLQNQ